MILISDPELVYWTYWDGEPDMVAILDPELHGPGELEGRHGGLDDAPFPHPPDLDERRVVARRRRPGSGRWGGRRSPSG